MRKWGKVQKLKEITIFDFGINAKLSAIYSPPSANHQSISVNIRIKFNIEKYFVKQIITILILILIYSCNTARNENATLKKNVWSDNSTLSEKDRKLKEVWNKYKEAIRTKDSNEILKLSLDSIYCFECYYNNNENGSVNIQDDSKLRQKEFIPIDKFIRDNLSTYFGEFSLNDNNISWINERNETYFPLIATCIELGHEKCSIIEVSISDNSCEGEECSKTIYSFVQTRDGYKFCGFIQIP